MNTQTQLPKWSDDRLEYAREWARLRRASDHAHRRKLSEKARAWQLANPVRNALNQYRARANRRGLAWELSPDRFETLVGAECHYCGAAPPDGGINGVDRVDSGKGYTYDNVVTACVPCNYAKRDQPVEAFLAWAKRIVKHQEG